MGSQDMKKAYVPDDEEQVLIDKFLSTNAGFVGPDPEIIYNHKYGSRTELEAMALAGEVDYHQFQEIRTRLLAILDQDFEVAEQTVAAPAAKFADMATAFMTAPGDIALLSNRGVAAFAVVMHYPVRHILKYWKDDPTVGVEEGDAFLINDARFGGIHNPDQSMVMPFFHDGQLVAWTVCALHEGEVGARAPGGMGPSIESPYEEGFRGSPIKIAANFALKSDLVTLLQNSVREKETQLVDLRSRLASCFRLYQQLQKTISEYGLLPVVGTLRHTMELVAEESRKRITEMPDGTVRHAFHFDSTSREAALIKVNTAFTVKGDTLVVSFKGSSPELFNRAINCPQSMSKLAVMVGITSFFWPDLPKSPAVLQHVDFEFDDNSLMNASYDVPIAMNVSVGFKAITAVEILFSKLSYGLPEKFAAIKAPWYNQPAGMMYGGITQHGHEVGNVCADLNGMAGGARWNRDGEHSVCANFAQMCDIGESEGTEEDLPVVMFSSKRFTPDVGSFGKFRGGAGYQTLYSRYGKNTFGFQAVTTGSKFPSALGLFGGYSSPCYPIAKVKGVNIFEYLRDDPKRYDVDLVTIMNEKIFPGASYETVPGSMEFEPAFEGELYALYQGSGGGYGDVLERDPLWVMKDLKERLISHETARELYGVVYDEDTLLVDQDATNKARAAQRKARIAKGKKWEDFVAEDVKKSPPIGILYFGCWNQSEYVYGGMYRALPGEFPREIILPDTKAVYEAVLKRRVISGFSDSDAISYEGLSQELLQAAHPKTLAKLARVLWLMGVMNTKIMFGGLRSLFAGSDNKMSAFKKALGRSLAKFMHDCGPTFIKLGQVLSTRPDLLSRDVTEEMSMLQDDVAPMPSDIAMALIAKGLGRPLSEVFKGIDRDALAAGSVAQVHRAVLHDGKVVAVKVKRPNLEESVSNDLRALSALVGFARTFIPGVKALNPRELINELGSAVRGQMDFHAEVANNRRFARELAHLEWLRLPAIYDEFCSDSVITMEFVTGKTPAQYVKDRGSYDAEMAEKVYRMYIEMAFSNRFLHADLHSGNIMVGGNGEVILIDTGLAHEFPGYYVKRYLRAYLCVAAVDGYLQGDNYLGDRPHLATAEVKEAFSYDMHVMYQTWHETGAKDLTTLWVQIMGICHKHRVPLDRELLMMMVADITMSGIVHEFDPEFDVVEFVRQELPRLVFQDGKLALDDPFLLAAVRRDLLKEIRSGMGIDISVDERVLRAKKKAGGKQ